MSRCSIFIIVITTLFVTLVNCNTNVDSPKGYRLESQPTYIIIAPKVVRPNEIIKVSITILKMYFDRLKVRGSVRSNNREYASFVEDFTDTTSRTSLMKMQPNCPPGEYKLRVEGSVGDRNNGFIFENETSVIFLSKQVSVFILISKPIYRQGMTVNFRIIPVLPNMLSSQGSFHIFVVSPKGVIVRRWLSQLTNAGIYEKSFQLSKQPPYGTWKIKVKAWDFDYEKTFEVYEFYKPRFYVNVTMPLYITEDSFGLAGTATANYTSGRPARGSAAIHLEIRPASKDLAYMKALNSTAHGVPSAMTNYPTIDRKMMFLDGKCSFIFTMKELRRAFGGRPSGKELHVTVYIYDWFQDMNRTGKGITVIYDSKPKIVLLGDLSRTFKPGFKVSVYFAVVQSNGSPLKGHQRQVIINTYIRSNSISNNTEKLMYVREDGIIHYEFIAPKDATFITILANYDTEGMIDKAECRMSRVYSIFNNYLHISTSTETPRLNRFMIFTVQCNILVDRVYYMIVAGGNIVMANSIKMNMHQRTFSVSLSRDMAPSARIVAYYVMDSEIVADSLSFFINSSDVNSIRINVNRGKDLSLNTIELSVWTEPGVMMAYHGIDFDMFSHGGSTFLTEREVIDEMEKYDSYANKSYSHTWYYDEAKYQHVYFPSSSYGIDTNTTFTYAGLVVMTDANSSRIEHNCNETLNFLPCNDQTCYLKEQRCDGVRDCDDSVDEMGCENKNDRHLDHYNKIFTRPFNRISHVTQHYVMSGNWLWKSYFVKPDGRIDRTATVPILPMQWVVSAISVSPTKGLSILPEPFRYPSVRPFYIRLEVPNTAKLGEQIGVRVSVFNYWDRPIECLVTLYSSPDYRFVLVTNEVREQSSYAPETTDGDIQTMVYIEPSRNIDIYLPVLPIVRGKRITITAGAKSSQGEGKLSKQVNVIYDGVTNYYSTPYFINLLETGSVFTPDFWITVPYRFVVPEERHHRFVPGSPRAFVTVVGDVLGTGFIQPVLNSRNTLNKPFGSAESALYNLAVNIQYLKFMRDTRQLNQKLLVETLEPLNKHLQRILSYMNADGSFSMFRDYQRHTPSTWLTAIALKTLEDADVSEWRTLGFFIPVTLRNRIGLWLARQHNPITGEFYDRAPNYDRKMIDQRFTATNGSHICLTSHVLAVLSTTESLTGDAKKYAILAKNLAVAYVVKHLKSIKDKYMICIVAYALELSKSTARSEAYVIMDAMSSRGKGDTGRYWSNYDIKVNIMHVYKTVPLLDSRIPYPCEAEALEATSYALHVYMRRSDLIQAKPIMYFIQALRNHIGGFVSTRDTIVAMEALAEYGRRDTTRDMYDLQIYLTLASDPNWSHTMRINISNLMIPQTVELPKVYGQVKARMTGIGLAQFMLTSQMNVEVPDLQAPQPRTGFLNSNVDIPFYAIDKRWTFSGFNSSVFKMQICAKWMRTDLWQRTGMTVLEVDVPTGYWMMNNDLRKYVKSGEVETLRRARFMENKIIFYFDYLDYNIDTCVKFRSDRWFPVANISMFNEIKLYDYYEPGIFLRDIYFTEVLFKQHICLVCASFQCPYCPFYNAAPCSATGCTMLVIFAAIVAMFVSSLSSSSLSLGGVDVGDNRKVPGHG